ncbi:MAG: ABC transporter ATP-binding protein [Leptospira sp.]|nr:ABC transporter ATP-binding protein [Leptospira sp.]
MKNKNSEIKISNLTKTYFQGELRIPILKGINLEIPSGHLITMMGPSGSGKSTFLNILSAIEPADTGRIEIFGENLTQKNEKDLTLYRRNTIGIVFQFFHLLPYLNALENTIIPLYLNSVKRRDAEKLGVEALKLVKMENRMTFSPKELSGGEKQRVAIARALVHKPKLILADEPTGNLDSVSSDIVMQLFQHCVKELGVTVFLVTHNPEIGRMGDIQLAMLDGNISKL